VDHPHPPPACASSQRRFKSHIKAERGAHIDAERGGDNSNGFKDFRTENSSRQAQDLAATGLFVTNSRDSGSTYCPPARRPGSVEVERGGERRGQGGGVDSKVCAPRISLSLSHKDSLTLSLSHPLTLSLSHPLLLPLRRFLRPSFSRPRGAESVKKSVCAFQVWAAGLPVRNVIF
jgi:hypothetical protein